MRSRLLLAAGTALAALLVFVAAGCGGSSKSGPASLAPPGTLVFVEGTVRPSGELKSRVDAIAAKMAGVKNLGDFIVEKIESSARKSGEPFDYAKEVEPWLGEKAGVFLERFDGHNFASYGIVLQSTDTSASREFIDSQAKSSKHPVKDASYQGVAYKVDSSEDTAIGVVGDFVVIGRGESVTDGERAFKDAVDASKGDALAGQDRYKSATKAAPRGSLADVYVDVGGLIRTSGSKVSPQALGLLTAAGIDPTEATALASLVPGSEQVEVDLSSNIGGGKSQAGDASKLLGSLPAGSFAALAVPGFGKQLEEAIDSIDASGIPPELPPHKLKSTLAQGGLDLDKIVASLRDAAVFASGSSKGSLGGALVLTTAKANDAAETVASIGTFSAAVMANSVLKGGRAPSVTPLRGKASGFLVRSRELGSKPLVVAAKGNRIAIGYGLPATLQGLSSSEGETLAGNPDYKAAVASLGGTPIGGFVDGTAALRLAEALVPASEKGFREAKPYLAKIRFLALGAESEGKLAKAKLIVGLAK